MPAANVACGLPDHDKGIPHRVVEWRSAGACDAMPQQSDRVLAVVARSSNEFVEKPTLLRLRCCAVPLAVRTNKRVPSQDCDADMGTFASSIAAAAQVRGPDLDDSPVGGNLVRHLSVRRSVP